MKHKIQADLREGRASLGIEFGSTRIKAVLISSDFELIADGAHNWENRLEDGIWTYDLDAVWAGLQDTFNQISSQVQAESGLRLEKLASIGISAMMHGYLPLDDEDRLLVPFRTWRNTMTGEAAAELVERFQFNIPQRWSIAHLYQAILNGEEHLPKISFLTTLAGYVHYKLTGEKVLGVGDASGMFPIDSETVDYDAGMADSFDELIAVRGYPWKLRDILPRVLIAGDDAGRLTAVGARLLDPSGSLEAGIPFCPPEGDAGTGMCATNAVAKQTGNVSAGTSIFAMIVLEQALKNVHVELDMVTTPSGSPVAMVHCNNCTNEIDAWASLFKEFLDRIGQPMPMGKILDLLYAEALEGEPDAGGIVLFNYLSGEPITGMDQGSPLVYRAPEARFSLSNVMRAQLYSALATLKIGLDILAEEDVAIDKLIGHGGFFKAPGVGQRMLAAASGIPVSVMATAGEGGAWGMALLAAYQVQRAEGQTLEQFLEEEIFVDMPVTTIEPVESDVTGFASFMERYKAGLSVEAAAVESLKGPIKED